MAKFAVKYKEAMEEAAGQIASAIVEQIQAGNYDPHSVATAAMESLEIKMLGHVRAAMREHDFEIGDDEMLTKEVLTREVSRKTGIKFLDVTNKDAVVSDIDNHVSKKINAALSTDFVSVMDAQALRTGVVDVLVAQIAKGGIGAVMNGAKAKMLRSGIVYGVAINGKTNFNVSLEHRKMMQRIYQKRYRRTHKKLWLD